MDQEGFFPHVDIKNKEKNKRKNKQFIILYMYLLSCPFIPVLVDGFSLFLFIHLKTSLDLSFCLFVCLFEYHQSREHINQEKKINYWIKTFL